VAFGTRDDVYNNFHFIYSRRKTHQVVFHSPGFRAPLRLPATSSFPGRTCPERRILYLTSSSRCSVFFEAWVGFTNRHPGLPGVPKSQLSLGRFRVSRVLACPWEWLHNLETLLHN